MPVRIVRAKKKNPIGKKPPKTSRTHYSVATRKAVMTLIDSGLSLNKACKRFNMPLATAGKIKERAEKSAAASGIDVLDDRNCANKTRPDPPRPYRFSQEEGNCICDYITSCSGKGSERPYRENDLTVMGHIKKLDLPCSVTTLNKIMYARGYVRDKHGQKCLLKDADKPPRRAISAQELVDKIHAKRDQPIPTDPSDPTPAAIEPGTLSSDVVEFNGTQYATEDSLPHALRVASGTGLGHFQQET